MSSDSGRQDMSVEDILADIKERSIKYENDESSSPKKDWSLSDVDMLLGIEGAASGFSDYDSVGDEELIYIPETKQKPDDSPEGDEAEAEDDDDVPGREAPVEAASFDDPEMSERYSDDGVFEDYLREVRRKKSAGADDDDGAGGHINPFSQQADSDRSEQRQNLFKALGSESESFTIEPAPEIRLSSDWEKSASQGKTVVAPDFGLGKKPDDSTPDVDTEEVDGQITLNGFDFDEDAPEKVDEEEVEEALSEKRKKKIRDFTLYKFAEEYETDLPNQFDDEEDEDDPGEEDDEEDEADGKKAPELEYRHFSQRGKIAHYLIDQKRGSLLSSLALAVIEAALIVLSVMSAKAAAGKVDVYYAASVFLLAAAAAIGMSSLIAGFKAAIKLRPNCDTAAALSLIFAFVHSVAAFAVPGSAGISGVYCAAAVFTLLLNQISRFCANETTVRNFRFCSEDYADSLYSIRGFDTKRENMEIGKNLLLGDPELRYSCRTKFPSGFIKHSKQLTSVDRMCKRIVPIGLGASLIIAAAGWIKSGAVLGALTSFTGALCISMPAGAAVSVTLPMLLAAKKLNSRGAMIASPESAAACGRINAIAADAVDLFDKDLCNVFGFKDYKAVRIDDVLLYAAAMVIASDGPLSTAFEKIVGSRNILPPVKSLRYEDKLGLSAWIHNQKVLLGNRNLLINHSIEAPPKTDEIKYLEAGKRVLYMAVENRVAIMFVVGYMENNTIRPYLQSIQNDGINILVNSTDCNITEEFINEGFDLISGGVKLMNPASGAIYRENRDREKPSASAAVMHDGRTESFLHCVAAAVCINNISRIAALAQIAGSALGLLMLFIVLLITGVSGIGTFTVIIFVALWTLLSTIIGIVQSKKKI